MINSNGSSGQPDDRGASHHHDLEETFIRLFEEYPSSQEFFVQFRGSPIEEIRNNVKMTNVLKEHAVRVFQLVEKVIGRLDNLHKGFLFFAKFSMSETLNNKYHQ